MVAYETNGARRNRQSRGRASSGRVERARRPASPPAGRAPCGAPSRAAAGGPSGGTPPSRAGSLASRRAPPARSGRPSARHLGHGIAPALLVEPVEVLDDAPRVVDDMVLMHEDRYPSLSGQIGHLVAVAPPDRHSQLLEVDPGAPQPAGDLAAPAQPVGRRLAA